MPDSPAPALDIGALVERLRAAGFRVDTRQYLTAHELLLAYAAEGVHLGHDVRRLTACLAPIFCTSPDEQQRFADEIADWLRVAREQPRSQRTRAGVARLTPVQPWKRVLVAPVLAMAVIAIVCALLAARFYLPIETTGVVQVQLPDGRVVPPSEAPGKVTFFVDGAQAPLGGDGAFVVRVARARVVTVEARLGGYQSVKQELSGAQTAASALLTLMPPPTVPPPATGERPATSKEPTGVAFSGETATRRVRWPMVAASALATALIALAALAALERFRRRLALGQLPVHGDPEAITLAVPEAHVLPASELDLRRVAIALRRPRESAALDLDIADTVADTVRSAGFFQPRFSARRAMPEYVVLVSRRTPSDHQARTFDAVLAHLADQDVVVDTYSFVDDPRTCSSDHSGEPYGLRAVLERHNRATLIVAAETLCAFNRVTGRLAGWIEAVRSHERRIFVTTEAPDRWTDRESLLEQAGFVVLPATEGGWRVLANVDSPSPAEVLFPAPYTRPFPAVIGGDELRWLDRNEPPPDQIEQLLRELKEFLGPDGFAWMCACAIYPEISWALTLRVKGTERAASLLPSMSRLPWFRHGFMPVWLRRSLVAHIPSAEDRRLRTDLERLLEELAGGQSRTDSRSVLQIGRWVGPIDLLRAAPAGSPLQDRVFLGFMAGSHDAALLDAPSALGRLFRQPPSSIQQGRRAPAGPGALIRQVVAHIRFRQAINPIGGHIVAAAAIGLLSLVPLKRILTTEVITGSPQAMWFVEVPEDPGARTGALEGRAFFISRTEVTVGQYNACVADRGCMPLESVTEAATDPADWPVRNVSFTQAEQYCRWLEQELNAAANAAGPIADALAGRRDGSHWQVTLPDDEQWVWAATGGENRRFPWGNDLDDLRANFRRDGSFSAQPAPVGSFPRDMSPYGAVDMAGNVAEWTRTASIRESRTGGIRGGSFGMNASELEQQFAKPRPSGIDSRDEATGFRVVIASQSRPAPARPSASSSSPQQQDAQGNAAANDEAGCAPRTGGVFAPVYFAVGSMEISPSAQRQLAAIADELKRQKGILTIEGHAPSEGTAEYNLALSERRAGAVRSYITSLGIDQARLRTVSVGEGQPQCPNDTAAGRDANRRVEFRLTSGNSAPTITRIRQSPGGIGLPPTQFTFTADGVADADGDALTYVWSLSGDSRRMTTPTVSATFGTPGTYTVSMTVTDAGGASATASTRVQIGTLAGVWDITCTGTPKEFPSFPKSFVATIGQDGNRVKGLLQGGGRSQSFPAPSTLENIIRAPRQVSFGVESAYNVWADRDGDFYFSVTLDDRLQTMTGTSQYCRSVRGVRRREAMKK